MTKFMKKLCVYLLFILAFYIIWANYKVSIPQTTYCIASSNVNLQNAKLQSLKSFQNSAKNEYQLNNYLSDVPSFDEKWKKVGKKYLMQKEYEQAILAFRKAIKANPTSAENYFLLAYAYEKRGTEGLPNDQTQWFKLAEKAYRHAISLEDHLPSKYNLAVLLIQQQKYEEAKHLLEYILLVSPKNKSLIKKTKTTLNYLHNIYTYPNLLISTLE